MMEGKSPTLSGGPSSPALQDRHDFLLVPENIAVPSSSPSCLSVPSSFGVFPGHSPTGQSHFDFRRASSTASSIFDLSYEAEQLDKAIRDNDINIVKKILDVHHHKFNINVSMHCNGSNSHMGDIRSSIGDDSISHCMSYDHAHISSEVDLSLHRIQGNCDNLDRRESSTTENTDVPPVFKNALHVAVQHEAMDVLTLLLKYGIDPNEPGISQLTEGIKHYGSISEIPTSKDRKDVRFLLCGSGNKVSTDTSFESIQTAVSGVLSSCSVVSEQPSVIEQHEQQPSDQSLSPPISSQPQQQPCLQPPQLYHHPQLQQPLQLQVRGNAGSGGGVPVLLKTASHCDLNIPTIGESLISQRLSSSAVTITPTNTTDINNSPPNLNTPFNFSDHYTADILQTLPPLFLAVAEKNPTTVRILLRYGASANVQDVHGCTPLHLSASVDFQSWDCALALIEYGSKIHIWNNYHQSPSDLSPDLAKEQQRLLLDTIYLALAGPVGGYSKQAGSSLELPSVSLAEHLGIGAKILKRWNSDRNTYPPKSKSRSKKSRELPFEDREISCDRERTSSVSSSTKSRWSWNFKFSSSPPPSQVEEIEMDSKMMDSERVSAVY